MGKKMALIFVLITGFILTSCFSTDSTTTDYITERSLGSGIPINAPDATMGFTETTIDSLQSTDYEGSTDDDSDLSADNCSLYEDPDLSIDYSNGIITGECLYNNVLLTFNCSYSDYDISQVYVYSSEKTDNPSSIMALPDGCDYCNNDIFIYSYSTDDFDREIASAIAGSFGFSDESDPGIEEMIADFTNEYGFTTSSAVYNIDESDQFTDVMNQITSDNVEMLDVYSKVVLREDLSGLPIGVPTEVNNIYPHIEYEGNDGCLFLGINDLYEEDIFYPEQRKDVDVVIYGFENYQIVSGPYDVVPLEDCITNAVPGLSGVSMIPCASTGLVYGAELVYVPFSVGMSGLEDMWGDYEVEFIPVWAIYVVSGTGENDTGSIRAGVVYLNAITGEEFTSVND